MQILPSSFFAAAVEVSCSHFRKIDREVQRARRAVTALEGANAPDRQQEVGLLLHNDRQKECVWTGGNPRSFCSLFPGPPGTVNEQVHQPQPKERDYQELRDPSRRRVWITTLGKPPRAAYSGQEGFRIDGGGGRSDPQLCPEGSRHRQGL